MQTGTSLMALDVGERRIGVALAKMEVRFANPLTTLEHSSDIFDRLDRIATEHAVATLVIGLPRGLDGQKTAQTEKIMAFAEELKQHTNITIVFQDEALTSVKAEAELQAKRKNSVYNKADVDALAATYILEDYIAEQK